MEEARLLQARRQAAEAERAAKKRAAVDRYHAERLLEAQRQEEVKAVLAQPGAAPEDPETRAARVRAALEAAAARARQLEVRATTPARSQRLLCEASDKLRQVRQGVAEGADPARLAAAATEVSKVRGASTLYPVPCTLHSAP